MATLFCCGLGYSAQHYIAEFGGRFDRIAGTVTTREKAAAIAGAGIGGPKGGGLVVDGTGPSPAATAAPMAGEAHRGFPSPGRREPAPPPFRSSNLRAAHMP